VVQDLARVSVDRLKGELLAWSGIWTNTMTTVYLNNYTITNITDTNGMTIGLEADQVPITNSATVELHCLILDGNPLQTSVPVTTWDMITKSPNVVFNDSVRVVQSFLVDGVSFTLNGSVTFSTATLATSIGTFISSSISDWIYTNAPNLLYFTNNGALNLANNGHFGDDRPVPYSAFVNNGSINAASISVDSSYFQDSGSLFSSAPLNIVTTDAKLEGGRSQANGEVQFTANTLRLNNYQFTSGGHLQFNVSDALVDAGPNSSNVITTSLGFSLPVKPSASDLLGTTFHTEAGDFVEADHFWSGQDFGVTNAGYFNNAELGKLIIGPAGNSPLFFFSGVSTNGLYVDLLDLTTLGTNYLNLIQIDPSLTIYYAAAKLGFTPPPISTGVSQEPEEFLDGQFGGHLRWVSSFAGPNSSTTVLVNGQPVLMNKALRNSKIIDSDNDGIPNFYDPTPLGGSPDGSNPSGLLLTPAFSNPKPGASGTFSLGLSALPFTVYTVEKTTDLAHPNWQVLSSYTNSSSAATYITIQDTNTGTDPRRFYRVRIAQ
jgi:hypothetical protein